MKHILEYEEHEIKGLLGDLEGVGQSRPVQASVWLEYNYGRTSWAISKILTTEKFYASGDKDTDSSQILKKISEGKFTTENATRQAFKGKSSTWPEIPEFTLKEIQDSAKDYYRDEESYKKMYAIRNKEGENALSAFVSDLGMEAIDKSVSREDFGSDPPPDVHYKIYIAPPGSDCHRENNFYTLPNPVDVVEYKD
jgi:hypothetical protein